jgi:hypothetical protein
MQVFSDDFSVYGNKKFHLEQCRLNGISLNLKKCAFCVNLGILTHSVSWWFAGRSTKDYNNYCYANTYQQFLGAMKNEESSLD